CPPNTNFRRVVISPLSFHHYKGTWKYKDQLLSSLENKALPYGKISIKDIEYLKVNFNILKSLGHKWRWIGKDKYNHYFNNIWYLYHWEKSNSLHQQTQLNDYEIQKAKQVIDEKAFQKINFHEFAEAMNISPGYFSQRFKKA